jgi:hypothetical protein
MNGITFSRVTVLRGINFGLHTIVDGASSSNKKPILGRTSCTDVSFDIFKFRIE